MSQTTPYQPNRKQPKLKQYIKLKIYNILTLLQNYGRCPHCNTKLHKNQLGWYNCGPCFRKYAQEVLGD